MARLAREGENSWVKARTAAWRGGSRSSCVRGGLRIDLNPSSAHAPRRRPFPPHHPLPLHTKQRGSSCSPRMQAKVTSQKVSSSSEQYPQPRSPQLLAPNGKSTPGLANGSHPSTSSSSSTTVAPLPPPSPAAMSPRAQGKAKAAPPSPLPTQQHLSHSQLFRTPSPPPASIDDLKGELNNEAGGLIPLAAIIERVASEAYDGLLNLGET